jgi:LemA protein
MSYTQSVPTPSKRPFIFVGIGIGVLVVLVMLWYIATYNSLISQREHVNQTFAQVQIVTNRQAELIPNLVATVKGYAAHEQDTQIGTAEARASAFKTANAIDPGKLASDPDLQKKVIEAQAAMAASARSLITAVSESNPNLKANENFMALQNELEGSQNRIAVERRRNQQAVQEYNIAIQGFFTSIVAGNRYPILAYYEAPASAQITPVVNFQK